MDDGPPGADGGFAFDEEALLVIEGLLPGIFVGLAPADFAAGTPIFETGGLFASTAEPVEPRRPIDPTEGAIQVISLFA